MSLGQSIFNVIYRVVGGAEVKRTNDAIESSNRRVTRSMGAFARGLAGTRSSIIATYGAFAAYGYGIARVIRRYEQFSAAQSRLRVIVASTVPNVERGTRQVSDLALSVARDLGYSSTESLNAMSTLMETGLGAHESMAIFRHGMELARVSGMTTSASVEFLTDTMNLFRQEQRRTNESSQDFSLRMSQQLVVSAQRAATNVTQLRQAFRYAATEMATMGFSSQEIMSALAGLSVIGVRGQNAGTRLRGAIVALHRPTDTTIRQFEEWGIREQELRHVFYDEQDRKLPLAQGMDNLYSIFRRLPSQMARNAAMSLLFGQRSGAAGVSLAQLTQAGARTRSILQELQGDLNTPWDRMLQTRMQGFDIQMRQLREGLSDLAISFGQELVGGTTAAGEGFGTYTRRLSEAVMLADPANRQTAEARRRWAELGPEMQQTGVEMRQFFRDLAMLTKQLVRFVMWLARVSAANPWKATIAAIALWGFGLGGIFRGIIAGVRGIGITIRAVSTASIAQWTALFSAGAILATIAATGELIELIESGIQRMTGGYGEFNQAIGRSRESTEAAFDNWIRQLPLIGTYLSTIIRLIDTIIAAWDFAFGSNSRETRLRRDQQRRSATWREAGGARGYIAQRSEAMGLSGEGGMRRAASMETSREAQRLADAFYAAGIRDQNAINVELMRSGRITNRQARANLVGQIWRLQGTGSGSAMRTSGQAVLGGYAGGLAEAVRDSTNRINGYNSILYEQTNALSAMRTQRELASVDQMFPDVTGRARALPAQQRATSEPAQPMTTFTGEFTIPVDVRIGDDEIAQFIGRQQIQHMERSGQSIPPGVRRTLRESGFAGRSG